MPTYLPRAAPGNFPKVLGEAERKAGEFPPHTTTRRALMGWKPGSVRRSSACISQSGVARGHRLLAPFFWTAGPCVPRGVRPPQASGGPQRHHPIARSPVPDLPLHSLEPGRWRASPGAAAGQPFPVCPRLTERPKRGQDPRRGDAPHGGPR